MFLGVLCTEPYHCKNKEVVSDDFIMLQPMAQFTIGIPQGALCLQHIINADNHLLAAYF